MKKSIQPDSIETNKTNYPEYAKAKKDTASTCLNNVPK
jgi:hypothetical protein